MFGIDFPPYRTRLEMLDEGAQIVKALWSGEPADFQGVHYSLEAAESLPLPVQPSPTLIMGGKGKKTLAIVARLATEWNFSYAGLESFRLKSAELDQNCLAIGRDPATLRRSLMIPFVIGRDEAAVQGRIDAQRRMFSVLPETLRRLAGGRLPGGKPGTAWPSKWTLSRKPASSASCCSTTTSTTSTRLKCWLQRYCHTSIKIGRT